MVSSLHDEFMTLPCRCGLYRLPVRIGDTQYAQSIPDMIKLGESCATVPGKLTSDAPSLLKDGSK